MKRFKYVIFLFFIIVATTNTFAVDHNLLEKEKKYVSELLPSMMLNGHKLDLHKDLGLNPQIVDKKVDWKFPFNLFSFLYTFITRSIQI